MVEIILIGSLPWRSSKFSCTGDNILSGDFFLVLLALALEFISVCFMFFFRIKGQEFSRKISFTL